MLKSSAASASVRFPWRRSASTRMNTAPRGRWTRARAWRVGTMDPRSNQRRMPMRRNTAEVLAGCAALSLSGRGELLLERLPDDGVGNHRQDEAQDKIHCWTLFGPIRVTLKPVEEGGEI